MGSNSEDSVNSASPTSPKVGRGLFQGAWNAFKAVFNDHAADTPATQILDGIYVEVFDDMETAEVNSKMAGNKEHVEQKPVTNLEKKVYDLSFLLELGKKASKAPHPLRFSSDAIKQNILKVSNLNNHKDPRARGLSNVSKESMGSEAEEVLFKRVEAKEPKEPCRQPKQPPDTPLAQIHAGFRRFLKEHSSPPHNRVTAGGRIVPVGPHGSSPPSLNLSSIADVIHAQAPAQATDVKQVSSTTGNAEGHGQGGSLPATENVPVASTHQESQGNFQYSQATVVTAQATTGQTNVYVPGFPTPLPFGAQVIAKLAHGPTLVVINGVLLEAISDGPNTILAYLNGFQQGQQLASASMLPAFPMVAPLPMASMQAMPLMNATNNVPIAFNQPAVEVQRQVLQKQLDELRAQLDQLDKHVALHRPEFGSYALSAVVAQRRQLVVQIDETRVAKENLDKPTQMNPHPFNAQVLQASQGFGMGSTAGNVQGQDYPGIGLPVLAGGPSMHGVGFPVHTGYPVQRSAAQLPSGRRIDSGAWKAQQPYHNTDAQSWQQHSSGTTNPAFSSTHSATQSNPSGLEYGKDGWKVKEYNRQNFPGNVQGTGYEPPTFGYQSGAMWSNGQGPFQQPFNANVQGHSVIHNGFTNNQPSYGPAHGQAGKIPKVSEQEASYATRLGLNPPNEPKKYCSTPAEFVEVMRQARDHARLYGRVGWSPNDDQEDAEEDIRFAMLDDRRIPLPKAVPDYVTNPQPYDFEAQYQKFFDDLESTGATWGTANNQVQWQAVSPNVHGYPINREHPAQAHAFAQAQAELSLANQYKAAYGPETTAPVSAPVNPANIQTAWIGNGNGNGELTRQPKHAYVEDAPETPARYGFNNGSLSGGSDSSPAYPAMPNKWNLPTLDECDTEGKFKASKATSIDSWSTQSNHQPDYMKIKWRFEIDGKEVTEQEARADMFAEELAEQTAMNSSSGQNNQNDFLRTMLRDPRHSSADSQTKAPEDRIEELRQLGLNSAGFPINYYPASNSLNNENQKSGTYSATPQFPNGMATAGRPIGGMQHFGGPYSGTQQFQHGMPRDGERIGGMQQFGGSYSGTQQFQNMMAREGERSGGMQQFGGPYSGTEQLQKAARQGGQRSGGMQHFGGYNNSRAYKAGPSVGAPLYQARRHVPQYDGAMDSLSSEAPVSTEASSEASSRRSSGQVTRAGPQAGVKSPISATAPSFFYEPVRRFPTSEGLHYEAVDKFFNTIREEERAEIAKYKAQFPLL